MKVNRLLPSLIVLVFILSGCGIENTSSNDSSLPVEDGAKEINIEVLDYSPDFYENAAKKFEKETGVKVNVVNDYKEGQSIEDIIANSDRMTAELMAGKGSDIYAGFYFTIDQNKHLCNMAGWISQDPDFTSDSYYMNIMKSQMVHDKMYAFPLFFLCRAFGSDIEVPELNVQESLSWEQFFERTKEIKRSGALLGLSDVDIFQRRYKERTDDFINAQNKKEPLNSPEMIKLLTQCKEWGERGLCVKYSAGNQIEVFENAFFKEYTTDIVGLTNIQCDPNQYLFDIPSDSSTNNRANKISPADLVCVNAASECKGTAWKFIKFLLSEEIQSSNILYTPVNRKAAEKCINDFLIGIVKSYKLTINVDEAIEDTSDALSSIGKIYNINPTPLELIVLEEAERYFKNEISAEEAAKNMADKTELYFKEQ